MGKIEDRRSERFMVNIISIIDKLLKRNKIDLSTIDIFTVDVGPGDFTGTRIGISILKAFSLVENKPVFGIDTLDIFAVQLFINNLSKIMVSLAGNITILLVPILDVKRDELFFSFYGVSYYPDKKEKTIELSAGRKAYFLNKATRNYLVDSESFILTFNKLLLSTELNLTDINKVLIIFSGTAFNSYRALAYDINKLGHNFIFDRRNVYPKAEFLNLCTHSRVKEKLKEKISNTHKVEISGDRLIKPFYVREFIPFGKS
jgi:tRNA threonylcarbamoyl adenosine modification protein YeaZ